MMEKFNAKIDRRVFLKLTGGAITVSIFKPWQLFGTEPPQKEFTFVQLCDTQLGMGGYEHDMKTFRQAVKQINELKPDFVLICGDLVHTPDQKSFDDFNQIKEGLKVPCYCVSGNHDVKNEPTQESLQFYRKVVGEDYYSFEHKGYVFAVVNTQLWKAPQKVEEEVQKHDEWLRKTLKDVANKQTPVFIVGHYPFFLKHVEEDEKYMNLPVAKRKELLQLFEKHGVVAVLGGHRHKLLINKYKNIQLVNAETTSKNFDDRPLGFRVWHIEEPRPFNHEPIPLEGF